MDLTIPNDSFSTSPFLCPAFPFSTTTANKDWIGDCSKFSGNVEIETQVHLKISTRPAAACPTKLPVYFLSSLVSFHSTARRAFRKLEFEDGFYIVSLFQPEQMF